MHELTKKLWSKYPRTEDNIYNAKKEDSIITSYLSECAVEIIRVTRNLNLKEDPIMQILGLEEKLEKSEGCQNLTHWFKGEHHSHPWSNNCPNTPKPKPESWCEHIEPIYGALDNKFHGYFSKAGGASALHWDICPVKDCHAPRPKTETVELPMHELTQKVWEAEESTMRGVDSIIREYLEKRALLMQGVHPLTLELKRLYLGLEPQKPSDSEALPAEIEQAIDNLSAVHGNGEPIYWGLTNLAKAILNHKASGDK